MPKTKSQTVQIDRRSSCGRRKAMEDRRKQEAVVAVERRTSQRRKTPRRRQIDPTTCERDYSVEEVEFMQALDAYKRSSGRMFPTCSEILEVVRAMGYARTDPADRSMEGEGGPAEPPDSGKLGETAPNSAEAAPAP